MEFCHVGVQTKIFPFFELGACTELVEDMVVPFGERLEHDTRSFEQVGAYACTDDFLFTVKENLIAASSKIISYHKAIFIKRTHLNVFTKP